MYILPWYLGTPLLILWLWLAGRGAGEWFRQKYPHPQAGFWAAISLGAGFFTILSLIYFIYALSATVIILSTLTLTPLVWRGARSLPKINWERPLLPRPRPEWFLIIGAAAGLIALVIILYAHRTTDVLNSPWLALPTKSFLLLYATTTALVLTTTLRTTSPGWRYALISAHLLITYAVTLILYPLGFGFDAFIHRATEQWIATHDFVLPKQPFYIGQYVSVVWLTRLSGLPLFWIDVWLVPVLAALILPRLLRLVWLYPALFFLWLGLTTPYNLALLLTFATVMAILEYTRRSLPIFVPGALAAATLVTHPLLGGSLVILILTTFFIQQIKNRQLTRSALLIYWILIVFSAPLLFIAYLWHGGHPLPDFVNPLTKLNFFLELFKPTTVYSHSPLVATLLQWFDRLIGPLVALLALIGLRLTPPKSRAEWLLPLTASGLVVSSWLLRSWIVFPEVGVAEQGDYPLRLIKASVLFLLPWVSAPLHIFFSKKRTAAIVLGTIILTVAFYISYPQPTAKGYNVTAADLTATAWIYNDNQNYEYIVLSNPITAVAALSQYSFAKYFSTASGPAFYYAIPSGSHLFSVYTKMYKAGPTRALMNEAMDFAGVRKSYFVINSYWAKFDATVAAAKKTADSWQSIDGGKIFIFTYKK